MLPSQQPTSSQPGPRKVFDLLQDFTLTTVLSSLEITGLLSRLEEGITKAEAVTYQPCNAALLNAIWEYLVQREILYEDAGVLRFTALGSSLHHDKGYLVWLSGGYGHVLHQLHSFLSNTMLYGKDVVRGGQWVAVGSALLGKWDVAPYALDCLKDISFKRALDLGCGSAKFLLSICQTFGCSGVGVDISAEACEEARHVVHAARLDERVRIVQADAANLRAIPDLAETQLVSAFFVLHEIFALGSSVIVDFLKNLKASLPDKAYLLIAEVTSLPQDSATLEWFTPEYSLLHAVMGQSLATEETWRNMLEQAGFVTRRVVPIQVPGAVLLLCQAS